MAVTSEQRLMTISIQSINKSYGRYPALNGVSLEVKDGELLALLGPSGSGKTTLLRTIAGLEFPEAGKVLFHGEDVTYAGAADRRVGFVFQQYALFKHMTVARNVAFGLNVRKAKDRPAKADIAKRVDELLKLVELGELGGRFPAQLSGGQRQRVALARALALDPSVLLLDEPFGALDAAVRKSLRRELRRIHDATGVTTIFVTHDQEEALELADRVAILNQGRIEQVGDPVEVSERPASAFVAGFVGEGARFEGEVRDGLFTSGSLTAAAKDAQPGAAQAFVRPHQFGLAAAGEQGFEVKVDRIVAHGPILRLEAVAEGGRRLDAAFPRDLAGELAGRESVRLQVKGAHVFPV
jgi:sulfate transport system ATP-binding protein